MNKPHSFLQILWWEVKICSAILIAFLLLQGWWEVAFWESKSVTDRQTQRGLQHYQAMKRHLNSADFEGYSTLEVLMPVFEVVTLSDIAIGLMNLERRGLVPREELLPLIDEVKRRALSDYVSFYPDISMSTDFTTGGTWGLYLSHLNVIFGIHQYLHEQPTPDALQTRITKLLHEQSLKSPDAHIESFPEGSKWPADQSVTLLSLYLYDQVNDTTFAAEPISRWLSFMNAEMVDEQTGLYKSALANRWYKDIPRGNSTSWTIFYMAQFAPKEAEQLYARYRSQMWQEYFGVGGFREWPKGYPDRLTSDTGPIVAGIGTAATGLGVGPATLMRDNHHYTMIMRLVSLGGVPLKLGDERSYLLSPLLGEAILFSGETATFWFTNHQPQRYDELPSSSIGILILYLCFVAGVSAVILFFDVLLLSIFSKIKQLFNRASM